MTKEASVLDGVDRILERSRWMRFSLSFARGQWCAVFSHERGKIYGKACRLGPQNAVFAAVSAADMATIHLAKETKVKKAPSPTSTVPEDFVTGGPWTEVGRKD